MNAAGTVGGRLGCINGGTYEPVANDFVGAATAQDRDGCASGSHVSAVGDHAESDDEREGDQGADGAEPVDSDRLADMVDVGDERQGDGQRQEERQAPEERTGVVPVIAAPGSEEDRG